MRVVCHKLGGPQGGMQPSHCQNIFNFIKNQVKGLETQKQKKNQGNILVLLYFNQAIVLLWCSHYEYDINDGPERAQTGGEN